MEGQVIKSQSLVERSNILSPTFPLHYLHTTSSLHNFNHLAYCNHDIPIHDIIVTTKLAVRGGGGPCALLSNKHEPITTSRIRTFPKRMSSCVFAIEPHPFSAGRCLHSDMAEGRWSVACHTVQCHFIRVLQSLQAMSH